MQEALRRSGSGEGAAVDDYYVYEASAGGAFGLVDACRSFSGGAEAGGADSDAFSAGGAGMPLFLWTGSSGNKDPVAEAHVVRSEPDAAARFARAEEELERLFTKHIKPFFEGLADVSEQVRARARPRRVHRRCAHKTHKRCAPARAVSTSDARPRLHAPVRRRCAHRNTQTMRARPPTMRAR